MNKWLKILVGLILLGGSIAVWGFSLGWGFWNFGTAAWEVFKGGLMWLVIMVSLLFIMLGISELRE